MSDIDSDCDDVFTEDSKGSLDNKSMSGNEDNTRHMLNRKRRRGIIEKRRRDRINNSLSELRRLVPAAYEKQGSAKLEKAEILQLTVDHLRHLHSKGGFDMFGIESIKFLTDYHNVGFRECASEVARYLASFEGLDIQDPVKLRIMSHLQCFTTREVRSPHRIPRIPPCYPTTTAIPSFHYPHFTYGSSISDSKSDRRLSSASSRSDRSPSSTTSSMSFESRTSSVEFPRSAHPLIPVSPIPLSVPAPTYFAGFSQTSVVMSSNPPKTPSRTYRPWGTEIAY